jgi:hypothetical protein
MVSAERMEDAIELGEFHRAHIGRFLALLKTSAPSCHAGLRARIVRILRMAQGENNDGWVSRSDLLRRLGNVKTDDLTAALTGATDAGIVEKRINPTTTKPSEEWRLTPESDHDNGSKYSNYSHYSPQDAPESGESSKTSNTSNGVEKEIERVASILRTFTAQDLAGFRVEVAAASDDDTNADIDRAALALLDAMDAEEAAS